MTDDAPELRASDTDRERVAEVLRDALAEGRLDMAEFKERLEATYTARTYGELAPITRDLPAPGGSGAPRAVSFRKDPAQTGTGRSTGGAGSWAGRARPPPASPSCPASSARAAGPSPAGSTPSPSGAAATSTSARRTSPTEVVINCVAIMGGMQVTVPPGVEVVVRGIGIMGGFDQGDDSTPSDPDAPRVIVTGFAFWGGVGVERKPTRAEKQRLKEERRQQKLQRGDA